MALHHAQPAEVIDVRPYGTAIGAARSLALFKSTQLEVMRLVLAAGERMPDHRVNGEITLQCLEGAVEVTVDGAASWLAAGHLMYVRGGVVHALRAEQASSVLVTVVLCPDGAGALA